MPQPHELVDVHGGAAGGACAGSFTHYAWVRSADLWLGSFAGAKRSVVEKVLWKDLQAWIDLLICSGRVAPGSRAKVPQKGGS